MPCIKIFKELKRHSQREVNEHNQDVSRSNDDCYRCEDVMIVADVIVRM